MVQSADAPADVEGDLTDAAENARLGIAYLGLAGEILRREKDDKGKHASKETA